jgi:hypothetical protein
MTTIPTDESNLPSYTSLNIPKLPSYESLNKPKLPESKLPLTESRNLSANENIPHHPCFQDFAVNQDDKDTDLDPDADMYNGTFVDFLTAFMSSFVLSWLGFLLCKLLMGNNRSVITGALSGLGLSLLFISTHQTYNNGINWITVIWFLCGIIFFYRGISVYIRFVPHTLI